MAETGVVLAISLVIDSSGTMGSYSPEDVERAVNAFFGTIGSAADIDQLVDVSVYDSYDEVEFLGGFGKASSFSLSSMRYGGSWRLPEAIGQAIGDILDYMLMLDRQGRAHTVPLVIVISDNDVNDDCSLYWRIDELASMGNQVRGEFPRCVYVSAGAENHFAHHLPVIEFRQASNEMLSAIMREIAREAADTVRPRPLSGNEFRTRRRLKAGI